MASNRKQELLALLKGAKEAMNGQSLAEHFGVTRQIIVQDIALLRADGARLFQLIGDISIKVAMTILMYIDYLR